jgi:hypothetical protein
MSVVHLSCRHVIFPWDIHFFVAGETRRNRKVMWGSRRKVIFGGIMWDFLFGRKIMWSSRTKVIFEGVMWDFLFGRRRGKIIFFWGFLLGRNRGAFPSK